MRRSTTRNNRFIGRFGRGAAPLATDKLAAKSGCWQSGLGQQKPDWRPNPRTKPHQFGNNEPDRHSEVMRIRIARYFASY